MAGVRRRLQGVLSAKRHDKRSIEGKGDPLQRIEVGVSDSPLDSTLDHTAEAGSHGQFDPCPAATLAHRLDLGTDAGLEIAVPAMEIDRALGSSDAGHDRAMFILGPSLAVSRGCAASFKPNNEA